MEFIVKWCFNNVCRSLRLSAMDRQTATWNGRSGVQWGHLIMAQLTLSFPDGVILVRVIQMNKARIHVIRRQDTREKQQASLGNWQYIHSSENSVLVDKRCLAARGVDRVAAWMAIKVNCSKESGIYRATEQEKQHNFASKKYGLKRATGVFILQIYPTDWGLH